MPSKILLVDDDESILSLVSATLGRTKGYQILLADNGEEALEVARRETPQLVFLDVMMPGKSGFEVCHALKSDPSTAQVRIVLIANTHRASASSYSDHIDVHFSVTHQVSNVALKTGQLTVSGVELHDDYPVDLERHSFYRITNESEIARSVSRSWYSDFCYETAPASISHRVGRWQLESTPVQPTSQLRSTR